MGKFYRANQELKDYLLGAGLTFHDIGETNLNYFTEPYSGKQVKIDTKSNLVSLIDAKGNTIDFSSSFTDNQIIKFLDN